MRHDYAAFLSAIEGIPYVLDAPMRLYTTYRIGGPVDILVSPANEGMLIRVAAAAQTEGLPLYMLGNGSNILVSDDGIRGVVVRPGEGFCGISREGLSVTAGAGVRLTALARQSLDDGLMGLEWAAGIPGTLGGAIAMNAGAYGGEIKQLISRVRYLEAGLIHEVEPGDADFGYRRSAYCAPKRLVLSATLTLENDDGAAAQRARDYTARRAQKQPLKALSAGSTFKRPPGHFAGALIEGAGLKGTRVGGAMVSELHAGFLINTGDATAADVLRLITLVQERVFRQYGVKLERELKLWPKQMEKASI